MIYHTEPIQKILEDCDTVLNIHTEVLPSTAVLDALVMGKPVMNISLVDENYNFQFIKDNAVMQVTYKSDLESFNVKWEKVTQGRFVYFNTLTKAQWPREGRITNWIKNEKLTSEIGYESIDTKLDRFMVCGSTGLNTDLIEYFESIGMQQGNTKTSGEFVVEKAFVRR